ncbi:hypothetical protein ZIOFF_019140 [Zingiber officinale]|uniref:FBD domain-containing protein n=1 Tax=Zingiber officinale TaxID=94328 RepID=A0A8J5HXJ6_ZINOF|nr:hypothetical protein ZIOFF_019140 [Zingiber officinale]
MAKLQTCTSISPPRIMGGPQADGSELWLSCKLGSQIACVVDGLEALITACPLLNKLCLIDMFDFGGLKSDKYYAAPGVICKLFRILYHLPSIKKIVLGGQAFKVWTYGELPIQLPCTYQLKHFHATVNFKDMQEMFAIVSLCRSCPLLVTLELEARFVMQANHETPVEKFWNSQQSFDCLFSQLKNLEITGVSSILELPFLKFVLANAPVLETAYIGFDYRLKTELDITREMIKFRRLSPAAEIKILKRKFRNASSMWA